MIPINKNISPSEQKRIDDIAFFCKCIGTLLLIVTTIYTIWNLQSNVKIPPGESPFFSLEWWVQGVKGVGIQIGITLSFIVILLMPRGKYKAGFTGLLCVGMVLSLFGTISYNQKTTAEAINSEIISESEYNRLQDEYWQLMDTNEQLKLGVIAISGTSKTREIDTENADDVSFRDLMLKKNENALLEVKEKMKIYENKGKNKSVVNAAFSGIGKLFGLKNKEDILRLLVHLGYAIFLDFGALLLLGIGPILRKLYGINLPDNHSQRLLGASTQKMIPKLPTGPDTPPSPFAPPPKGKGRSTLLDDLKSKVSQKLSQFNSPLKNAPQSHLDLDHIFTKPTPPPFPSKERKDPSERLSELMTLLNTLPQPPSGRIDSSLLKQNLDSFNESNSPKQNSPQMAPKQNDEFCLDSACKQNLSRINESNSPKQNSSQMAPKQNSEKESSKQNLKKTVSIDEVRKRKQKEAGEGGSFGDLMKMWDSLSKEDQNLRARSIATKILPHYINHLFHDKEMKDGQLRGYKSVSRELEIRERIGQECHEILKALGLIISGPNANGRQYSYPKDNMSKKEMLDRVNNVLCNDDIIIRRGGRR